MPNDSEFLTGFHAGKKIPIQDHLVREYTRLKLSDPTLLNRLWIDYCTKFEGFHQSPFKVCLTNLFTLKMEAKESHFRYAFPKKQVFQKDLLFDQQTKTVERNQIPNFERAIYDIPVQIKTKD